MRGKNFLHPDHIIPAVKFVAALYEVSDIAVAEMSVKILAVSVKMPVHLARGYADAGAEVVNIHFRKQLFERVIELFATPCFLYAISTYIEVSTECSYAFLPTKGLT